MTLPIQTLCGDKPPLLRGTTTQQQQQGVGGGGGGRRRVCLSAAWADHQQQQQQRKERRRAICSWSVGYGTLNELDEILPNRYQDTKKGKVADHATLLEQRGGRRLVTPSIAIPHATTPTSSPQQTTTTTQRRPRTSRVDILAMPGIKSFINRRRNSGGDTQSPLVNKTQQQQQQIKTDNNVKPATSLANLRKCETVLALTSVLRSSSSSSSIEPLQPINRLRISPNNTLQTTNSRMCSRCSSLLTLASTSRYSLNSTTGGFVQLPPDSPPVLCKLCLAEVPSKDVVHINQCNCAFCLECMRAYVEFEIAEGAYDISCPDAQCPTQGILEQEEIKILCGTDLLEKHRRYRLNREVELDKNRTWCPRAGCETVCKLCPKQLCQPQSVYCPTCTTDFCSNCKLEWHQGLTCDQYNKQLQKDGKTNDFDNGIPFNSDLIKFCPVCNVPIEKDEGCAQMMCKRCKHVFCWYCLASLDDDFLLRHYDKGPCKNKLGHSRASVIWHRTQVIGIFAGFGILLLVASPLLLLAAPCIVCCKCRVCNAGTTKLENEDDLPIDES